MKRNEEESANARWSHLWVGSILGLAVGLAPIDAQAQFQCLEPCGLGEACVGGMCVPREACRPACPESHVCTTESGCVPRPPAPRAAHEAAPPAAATPIRDSVPRRIGPDPDRTRLIIHLEGAAFFHDTEIEVDDYWLSATGTPWSVLGGFGLGARGFFAKRAGWQMRMTLRGGKSRVLDDGARVANLRTIGFGADLSFRFGRWVFLGLGALAEATVVIDSEGTGSVQGLGELGFLLGRDGRAELVFRSGLSPSARYFGLTLGFAT